MSIQSKIDQHIAKVQQVREFLSDPVRLALVKEFLNEDCAEPQPPAPNPIPAPVQKPEVVATSRTQIPVPARATIPPPKPAPARVFRGSMTQTAYECVLTMNQPFTARELIERVREAGYQFGGHPAISIQTALQKLVKEHVLEIVEEGLVATQRYIKPRKRRNS